MTSEEIITFYDGKSVITESDDNIHKKNKKWKCLLLTEKLKFINNSLTDLYIMHRSFFDKVKKNNSNIWLDINVWFEFQQIVPMCLVFEVFKCNFTLQVQPRNKWLNKWLRSSFFYYRKCSLALILQQIIVSYQSFICKLNYILIRWRHHLLTQQKNCLNRK